MKALILLCLLFPVASMAQFSGLPSIGSGSGLQGSLGAGFANFTVDRPEADLKLDRGIYAVGAIERAFFSHFYLTLSLSHMATEGSANYNYTNLSSTTNYTVNDVAVRVAMTDLSIGFKLKFFDDYWFRPYVEAGGLGGYHEVRYTSKGSDFQAQGNDAKTEDSIMASGFYYEGGLEAMFSDRFGVKLAGRSSNYQTKKLETLGNRAARYSSEIYYFAMLFGF